MKSPGSHVVDLRLRYEVSASDRTAVRELVAATGFFFPFEVDVAVELVDERLAKSDASGYFFVFAEQFAPDGGRLIGYACYGPVPCTQNSYDLYWIAVDPASQRSGIGRLLMGEVEDKIRRAGGRRIYLDTSSRPLYSSTQAFYRRCGFRLEASLKNFYDEGDDKLIFVKECAAPAAESV